MLKNCVKFNLVQKKIIHFVKKILEVRASVIITDGTICTTVFPHNLKYNTIVQFFLTIVWYCIVPTGALLDIVERAQNVDFRVKLA